MSTLRSVFIRKGQKNNILLFKRNVAGNSVKVNQTRDTAVEGKPWQEIPGPPSLPIIGQAHHFLPGGSFYNISFLEFAKKAIEKYGPIVKLDGFMGRPPTVILFDPKSAEQVYRGENWLPYRPGLQSFEYYRKHYNNKNNKTNQQTGLLTEQGESWKQFRSIVNPVMLKPKTIKLYNSAIDEVAKDMVVRLKSIKGYDGMITSKFGEEMNLWALESIGVIALGGRLNCFDPNLPEDSPARQLINVVHEVFKISDQIDFKPSIWRYIWTPTYQKAMNLYEKQDRLTKYFVNKAKQELKTKLKPDEQKGVLEILLDIDENVAHIMASDMLFAGVDTTANAMIFTLYLLANNQAKQEKLREEVMSQSDNKAYLQACIKESLRILPVVSGNLRQVSREYNLLGYKIPKDMYVITMHQMMSGQEENFKKANDYIPERWLVPKDDPLYYGNAHPLAYSPFGFGARMCIGRRIVELELRTFLTRIMQNFKVEWRGPPIQVNQTNINYAQPPFNFIFKDL